MKKIKTLIICIIIPLIFGGIGALLGNSKEGFKELIKPSFAPPAIVFPIVWTILFILMGVSYYRVYQKDKDNDAKYVYYSQLIVNTLWTLIFFRLKLLLIGYIWIILLIALVIIMIIKFYKIDKIAGYLQIPYLLWLIFASILSLSIVILN